MIDDPLNRLKVKRGSELPWAKLTEDDVRFCRELHEQGRRQIRQALEYCTAKALAEKFAVHKRTMEKVLSGESWGHVE
jgi:hypothetical protein